MDFTQLLEEKYFCSIVKDKVKTYFSNKENRKDFEVWYKQKYGKEVDRNRRNKHE